MATGKQACPLLHCRQPLLHSRTFSPMLITKAKLLAHRCSGLLFYRLQEIRRPAVALCRDSQQTNIQLSAVMPKHESVNTGRAEYNTIYSGYSIAWHKAVFDSLVTANSTSNSWARARVLLCTMAVQRSSGKYRAMSLVAA